MKIRNSFCVCSMKIRKKNDSTWKEKCVDEYMNGCMNEYMNEYMFECMNEYMNEYMFENMNEHMNE